MQAVVIKQLGDQEMSGVMAGLLADRALREENAELRRELADCERRLKEIESKYGLVIAVRNMRREESFQRIIKAMEKKPSILERAAAKTVAGLACFVGLLIVREEV